MEEAYSYFNFTVVVVMPTEMPTVLASEEPLSTALMPIDAGLEAVAGLVTDSDALAVAPGASDESEAAPNDAVQPAGMWEPIARHR